MFYNEFSEKLDISRLSLGTVKFGRNQKIKYPTSFTLPSDREIEILLEKAIDLGINALDTAPAYGFAERRIGQALGANSKNWIIGTKVGEYFEDGASTFDFSHKSTLQSLERSLSNLQRTTLDYVLLHSDGDDINCLQSEAQQALFEYKRMGVVRQIGISCKTKSGAMRAIDMGLDIIMVELNLNTQENLEICQLASDSNVKVLVKKGLSSGYANVKTSLNWLAQQNSISSIVLGTISCEHLTDNARIFKEAINAE